MPKKFWKLTKNQATNSAELMLYGPISEETWWGDEVTPKQFAADLKALGDVSEIKVRVNSGGGDVFAGQAIYSLLKSHAATVNVYVDGLAASIASIIAMAGDTVTMATGAMMMVHNPAAAMFGYYQSGDLREYADWLDTVKDSLVAVYAEKTGKDTAELQTLLDTETWYTASEAVAAGFADAVDKKQVAASLRDKCLSINGFNFDLSQFKRLPQVPKTNEEEENMFKNNVPQVSAPAVVPVVVTDQAVDAAAVLASERTRVKEINAACRAFGIDPASYIEKGDTVDKVNAAILATLAQSPVTVPVATASIVTDERDKFKAAATDALAIRCGHKIEKPAAGADELRGATLFDMARESLIRAGGSGKGYDRMQIVQNALSTSDFPYLLAGGVNKSMMLGYEMSPVTYPLWTKRGNLGDYKAATRHAVSEFDKLREVKELAEYKQANLSEMKETIQIKKYGEIFGLSREAIINDDLSALTDIPQKFGAAARYTTQYYVSDVLNYGDAAAYTLSDSVILFNAATHKNYISSTGTALSADSLKVAYKMMRTQKGIAGKQTLNIKPAFLIVPAALEFLAKTLIASTVKVGGTNGEPNPFQSELIVVVDPQLDDTTIGGSATAWYLAAAPGMANTVEVAFLNGQDAPYLEQRIGFEVDGVEWKVRHEFGCAPLDFRGMFKNVGA